MFVIQPMDHPNSRCPGKFATTRLLSLGTINTLFREIRK